MSTKRQIIESSGIYFITITCYEWLPLFELTNGYDIVYKWFDYLKKQGHYSTGYVPIAIGMPNHVHVLIGFRQNAKSINTVIGNGKRFRAYEIVKRIEQAGEHSTLTKLMEGVVAAIKNEVNCMRSLCHLLIGRIAGAIDLSNKILEILWLFFHWTLNRINAAH